MNKTVFSLLFSISLVLATNSQSHETNKQLLIEKIDSLVVATMGANDIPSLSACVIYKGEILVSKGFGFSNRDSLTKVDESTIYQIASLSKTFTGFIANRMIKMGQLNVDNSIIGYLPDSLSKKSWRQLSQITIKDLLTHYSGLSRDSKVFKRKDGEPMIEPYTEKLLLEELQRIKLKNQPGKKFEYSNLGFALLGYILEQSSKTTYDDLLKKYVVEPYDLSNTTSKLEAVNMTKLATPYRKESRDKKTKPWNTGKLVAASGIFSNVKDLSILMLEQLKAYRITDELNSSLILTKDARPTSNENSSYGFGLFKTKTPRGMLYGHRGDMDGFASEYSFNPSNNTGVILLTSSGGKWVGLLSARITKIVESEVMKN